MQKEFKQFSTLGAKIVVVIRDDKKSVEKYWKKNKLSYIGIPDNDKNLGNLYAQQWSLIKLGLMPALFVIDQNGKVQFVHYSSSMKDIPTNKTVFKVLESLDSKKVNTEANTEANTKDKK